MMYPTAGDSPSSFFLVGAGGNTSQKAILGIRRRRAKREIACTLIDRARSELGHRTEEIQEEEAGDMEEERILDSYLGRALLPACSKLRVQIYKRVDAYKTKHTLTHGVAISPAMLLHYNVCTLVYFTLFILP